MTDHDKLAEIRARLIAEGYDGLHFPGECACSVDDIAPCGSCAQDDGEEFINDCEPGYKHIDPTRPDFWVISVHKEPPSQGRFDELYGRAG